MEEKRASTRTSAKTLFFIAERGGKGLGEAAWVMETVWKGPSGVPGLSSAPWVTLSRSELLHWVPCFRLLNRLMDGGSGFFPHVRVVRWFFLFFPEQELYFLKCSFCAIWDDPMTSPSTLLTW